MVHASKYAEGRRTTKKMVCRVCLKDHPLRFCKKFLQGGYEERMRLVSIYHYCAGCLSHDHTWRTCESTGRCKRCGDMHHTLLHRGVRPRSSTHKKPQRVHKGPASSKRQEEEVGPSSSENSTRGPRSSVGHEGERPSTSLALVPSSGRNQNSRQSKKSKKSRTSQMLVLSTSRSQACRRSQKGKRPSSSQALVVSTTVPPSYHLREVIFLKPTAIVRLEAHGKYIDARVLIDSNSECSIISDDVVHRISGREVQIGSKRKCLLRLSGHHGICTVVETYAEVRRKYSVVTPKKSIDGGLIDEFQGLQLADPQFNVAAPVNILLGGDVYTRIVRNGVHGGSFGKPLAQFTIFGYIISGSCSP